MSDFRPQGSQDKDVEAFVRAFKKAGTALLAGECKCSLRIRLVGDGCPVCNPEYWAQFQQEEKANG